MCKHVGRFEEFTILRFDAEHTSTILRVFNKPAPSLKLISVKLGEEGVPYPDDQWLPEMALQIFDGSMPSLKDATIYDFPVSFAGIGHLLVLGLRIRSACTLDDLLAALRQNTLLESLTIDTDGLECTMDRSLVHLPRLRNFTVKGPQDDAIRILNSLVFPKRTNVSVQMWCLYPDDEEESVAEVYESSFKEHLRDARYVMFGIKENKKRQIVLVLISATKDAKVVVSWAIPEPPDDSDSRIIGPRTDMLDFANVRHLDIVTLPSRNVLESLLWENMLGLFPALQEIKVRAPLPPPVHPVPEEGLPPADPAPEEGPPIDSDNADETDLNPIGQYEPAMLRTIRELCYTLTMGAPDDSLGAEPGARKMLFPNIRNLAMLNKYLEHEEADELRELYEWWMEMRPSEGLARMSLIGPAN
ncbi:hypothetical protein EVJ58_g2668 [Rhodofomes roseus]|nr:hypothetical protein EVJ58_g2668 [Rhodofomes roseus]